MGLSAAGLLYTAGGFLYNSAGLLWSVVGQACACCGPLTGGATLYAQACPCYAFPDEVYNPIEDVGDCGLPEGECIYIDLRSVLSDDPSKTVAQRLFEVYPAAHDDPAVVVMVGGVCYRFTAPWALYCDPALTEEERGVAAAALGVYGLPWGNGDGESYVDLPEGASLAGGNGVELTLAVGGEGFGPCSEEAGCSPRVNTGADFFECFACDGSALGQRMFICARAAFDAGGGRVLDGCLCIDSTAVYSAGEVAALELEAGVTLHTLVADWLPVWSYGPGHPSRSPAPSCCFCAEGCVTGQDWSDVFGDDHIFPLDVCCGPATGLRYGVALGYRRVLTQRPDSPVGPGDVLTTTWSVTVDSLDDMEEGGTLVRMTVTIRGVRPATGHDVTITEAFDLPISGVCCLPYSGVVPSRGTTAASEDTFVDDWDGSTQSWYEVIESDAGPDQTPPIPDAAFRARLAWEASPWAAQLPLSQAGFPDDVFEAGLLNGVGGSCRRSQFNASGAFVNEELGRRDEVEINLVVTVLAAGGGGCGYIGACGSAGWGEVDLDEMLP